MLNVVRQINAIFRRNILVRMVSLFKIRESFKFTDKLQGLHRNGAAVESNRQMYELFCSTNN